MPQTAKFLLLGDLHIGALDPSRLELELETHFWPVLEEHRNTIDAVVQVGDFFHKRLSFDSPDAKLALRIATRLADYCHNNGILLRFVRGTQSHDFSQHDNFNSLVERYEGNFRIVRQAECEELPLRDGSSFFALWLPEEYPTDYASYYDPLFYPDVEDKSAHYSYDGIFGHGEIDVAAGWTANSESESHSSTPCHAAASLLDISLGPVMFGHLHGRFVYKRRLGYPGSFTRWTQGDESAKGFEIVTCSRPEGDDAAQWNVTREFIQNTSARVFTAVSLLSLADTTDSIDTMRDKIIAAAAEDIVLRVDIDGFPIGTEELVVLKTSLVDHRRISFKSSARIRASVNPNGAVDAQDDDGTTPSVVHALSYLRDTSIPLQGRLLRWIQENRSDPVAAEITLDDIVEATAPLAN